MDRKRFDVLSRKMGEATSRRGLLSLLGGGVIGSAVMTVGLDEARARSKHKHRRKRNQGNGHNGGGNNGGGGSNSGAPQNLGPFEAMTGIPISAQDQERNFTGTLDILRFEEQNGAIVAIASLAGTVTGNGGGTVNQQVTVPVSVPASSAGLHAKAICQVLDLILGPIDLNLLGLRLQVNQIHIQLTANSLGGILGSLLCALTGPLSGLPLGQLLTLLNQILAILQGL